MEIKDILNKPYSDKQRSDFIVKNNHRRSLEIRETETALEAWGLTEEEQAEKDVQDKQNQVRAVREQYFTEYVDWYQSRPLLWDEMTEEEKTDIAEYRQYLKDYTDDPDWYYHNPMTFEEWKASQGEE